MSPLFGLILQRKGELQTETVQLVMPPRPGARGVSAIPTASVAWFVAILGVMALQLSHPNPLKEGHSKGLGWSCGSSRARCMKPSKQRRSFSRPSQLVVACCVDRHTLTCLCLAEPIRRAVVGPATSEEEGFELVLRHKPSLLICSSDLETGYGMKLLRRVKAELPTCQLLIMLVRETQAVVQ